MSKTLSTTLQAVPATARVFLNLLGRISIGHLELITPDQTRMVFGNAHLGPGATLEVHDWRACGRILRAGDIGLGEAWAAGWVSSPDLVALLRLAIRNEAALEPALFGGALARCWYRLRHWLRPNTRSGSRRNIHSHYDIGNDFYRLWLDSGWTYSAAIFAGDYQQSLEQAQYRKYQRIIDTLGLRAGDRVLEIGCGWGGFAEQAARQGIHVHGLTISPSQLEIARQRIDAAGLGELAQLELRDYRDIGGSYDAVVSIEMFEAVGERYWTEYFNTVAARLKPGGQALVQSITIDERHFERYRSTADFIQEYIFPGGMLPSVERFEQGAARAGLRSTEHYAFGPDYAETLRRWRSAYRATGAQVSALGMDTHFMRIWDMYFAYCEAAFDEGRTDVVQFHLHKS
ncbi:MULTISPECIES: cyclopropane-fatty-acyl-phospholipid synthase family protein [unclassified Duganella]|jgi:cyclopropane-fatty-acyl-phospholipid synthase|uniref:SAM-dependent methyltransferase n=1 Tax=unclassified Duganella TaxID=2636909 RepID=UPI00087E8893|nr:MULTISPECIES: cyclopropane-fatty-acyl-phospholipid synthase family protein [unclassified Duganella]SDF74807.1 cyclopropane-fatty-acyl-phospholipid synthase [Duganella sp. OV458]SDI54723.1 cyclopropane-fatty-acyl-phospholipid synthase [Duganella sp. OV510]